MNPYDALPRRKARVAVWGVGFVGLLTVWRLVVTIIGARDNAAAGGNSWIALVIVFGSAAVLLLAVYVAYAVTARIRVRKILQRQPDATVFISGRGPELDEKLRRLRLFRALPSRFAVSVDAQGVSIWGRSLADGPLLTLERTQLIGLTAAMGETGTAKRTFTGPALGVIARLHVAEGRAAEEELVPIAIRGHYGLRFATKEYAWLILKSASGFLPLRQPNPAQPG